MPIETERRRTYLLFDVLGNPKALILLVVTYTYAAMATANGEFFLLKKINLNNIKKIFTSF
jgi:hypothetical protein